MPQREGPKRANIAPTRADGLRVVWLLAICAVAMTAVAGWLAADAASALGRGTATSTTARTGTTSTTAASAPATTTAATSTTTTGTTTAATTTTGTATAATTTTGTATAATTTGTATAATTTTGTTTAATTTSTTAGSTTTRAATTTHAASATATRTSTTPTHTTTLARHTNTQRASTVTVTVTAPTPATTTTSPAAAAASTSATVTSSDDSDAALSDALSSTLGDDSGALVSQSELTEALVSKRPPAKLVPIYKAAASVYDVPWQVLAAINAVESDYGSDESTSSAGAVGWMQFEPGTFAKYEIPNGSGHAPSPYNAIDAIFAAAHLLSANGASTNLRKAIYAYNHADWYVNEVTFIASEIVGAETTKSASVRQQISAMATTARLLNGTPYVWGGGHGSWSTSDGYDCSGFVSAVLHAAGYLSAPQTTQTLPSVADIASGPGKYVTLFDRTDASGITGDHVIIDIDGQWWESGGGAGDGGADDVHRIQDVSAAYLATFNLELHPRGL